MWNLGNLDLPPPRDWQVFEDLCRDLWSAIWRDPEALHHGRSGQKQRGVDVYGRPERGEQYAGVQCKRYDRPLTREEIEKEVGEARKFEPALTSLVIATTAPRDVAAQKAARQITLEQLKKKSFPVVVYAWEDVRAELTARPEILVRYYPHLGIDLERIRALRALVDDYLGSLWSTLLPLPMHAIQVGGAGKDQVLLPAVYTELDVTERVSTGGAEGRLEPALRDPAVARWRDPEYRKQLQLRLQQEAARQGWDSFARQMTALEAVAAAPRLVLVGEPGGGKSSFARFLVLCLAGEPLGRDMANLRRLNGLQAGELLAWPHGALVPIFVELARFVGSPHFPAETSVDPGRHLLAFVRAQNPDLEKPQLDDWFRQRLQEPRGAILILDGLDETSNALQVRERLRQVILGFCNKYPHCRVLVTSRPYAYAPGSPWRLDDAGFAEAKLAPFDDEAIESFVGAWYTDLASRQPIDVEARSTDLWRALQAQPWLRPLAERPLMLTMIASLHASGGGALSGGRAELYEKSTELLLDQWNQARDHLKGATTVAGDLEMKVEEIRRALEGLAYKVHKDRGAASGDDALITGDELLSALRAERSRTGPVDWEGVMDYLHQRSGILVGESAERYRFPHRSYQEYLAACHLTNSPNFPAELCEAVRSDPGLWREVFLLASSEVGKKLSMVWLLLEDLLLLWEDPPADLTPNDCRCDPALFAGLAVIESGLQHGVHPRNAAKLERIRRWQERILEAGALSPVDRAAVGRVLAQLGDRRPGVGLREDGLPDIAWVEIPAGPFVMGTDEEGYEVEGLRHQESLPAYRLGRYPVTNLQYGAFVADGGYTEKWRSCWTEEGWKWKGERVGPDDDLRETFLLPNHPRVRVTWYEAWSFSQWLGRRLGMEVRLPAEAEWEKGSRGTDGRTYPWGESDFPADVVSRCNVDETGLSSTCTVGMFPGGASPWGLDDMSGNVWEWCSTRGRRSYIESANEEPDGDDDVARVVRGGSFAFGFGLARCALRVFHQLDVAYRDGGFRVSTPSF